MFIHIGGGTALELSKIVGIFDLDTSSLSKNTRAFLRSAQSCEQVVSVAEDLPRSFVVCADGTVYLSALTSQTLKKRINIFE